jgi:hypothetical protein
MELADRRAFVVDDDAWTEIQSMLSRAPALPPALIEPLSNPSVPEGASQGAHLGPELLTSDIGSLIAASGGPRRCCVTGKGPSRSYLLLVPDSK